MKKLISVIVVYNSYIHDSPALKSLSSYDILVIDNSIDEKFKIKNQTFCSNANYLYHTFNGNVGLPKAYNYAFSFLNQEYEYILLSDDDTTYDLDFIDKQLEMAVDGIDVIVPFVYDFYSGIQKYPKQISTLALLTYHKILFGSQYDMFDVAGKLCINKRFFLSINTGTIIRNTLYSKINYNEELILGSIDSYFFNTINKDAIALGNGKVLQKASKVEDDFQTAIERQKLVVLEGYSTWGKFWYIMSFNDAVYRTLKYKRINFIYNYIKMIPRINKVKRHGELYDHF